MAFRSPIFSPKFCNLFSKLNIQRRTMATTKRVLQAVETHCGGSPSRIIVGGMPKIPGKTMFEKKIYLENHADYFRQFLLFEPRGSPIMMGNFILPPTHPDADMGYVIMEQTEYPPMSGHNTICVATVLLETGVIPMVEPVTKFTLESPAGLVHITAECKNGKATRVTLKNIPSFATHLDATLTIPTLGKVQVDVAYGGMFYVIGNAEQLGVKLVPEEGAKIAKIGRMLTQAALEQLPIVHPENPKIHGVTISQITGPPSPKNPDPKIGLKNAVTISNGALDWSKPETWTGVLDRSPCGTGTCAKMATLYARGKLKLNQDFPHESILNSLFIGRLVEETKVGKYKAVIPTISGQAFITGYSQHILDTSDPFPDGFTVGDIWGGSPLLQPSEKK